MSDYTNGTSKQINGDSADDKQLTNETNPSQRELEISQENVSNNKLQVMLL